MRQLHHFIDGAQVDSASGQRADVVDPATGQAYCTVPVAGEDVDGACMRPGRPSRPGGTRRRLSASWRC